MPASGRGQTHLTVRLVVVAALLAVPALLAAQQPGAAAAQPTSPATPAKSAHPAKKPGEADKKSATSYSLGVSMGEQLRGAGVSPEMVNTARVGEGLRDALAGKATLGPADQANIRELVTSAADANHHKAAAFLAENGKKTGVVTTASGLEYTVLAPGSGESPKATDEVTVNYRGTLLDGTEFDSSYARHEPANFEVDRVIPGWTEALQLMKPGSKYKLWIPPQLAYDMRSRPPIPPGSMLIFEVELISVKAPAPAASPTPQASPPPKP
ncbi:MAG: FKBP-type peptidyl-prolyl cis-trans isomerase [Steroidobacteraceae bacterium]